jgi:hypothetical protein
MNACAQCTCAILRRHYMTTQRQRYRDALASCVADYKVGEARSVDELFAFIDQTPTPCFGIIAAGAATGDRRPFDELEQPPR